MVDNQRMEQSLASIDRLIQRLVVLQEAERKGQKPHVPETKAATAAPSQTPTAQKAEKEVREADESFNNTIFVMSSARSAIVKTYDEFGKELVSQAKEIEVFNRTQATGRAKAQKLLDKETKVTFKLLNRMIDGSLRFNADTRQFISSFVSIGTTVVSDLTSFESSGAQALAASKGLLSSGQAFKLVAGEIANGARNITQFGFAAGGIMTAVSVASAYMRRQKEKLDHTVRLALDAEEHERGIELTYRQAEEQGKTSIELEREKAQSEDDSITATRSRRDELYLAGKTRSHEFKTLDEKVKRFDAEYVKRTQNKENLDAKIDAQRIRDEKLESLAEVERKLESDLYNARVSSYEDNFEVLKSAYASKTTNLEGKLHKGIDEAALSGIIDSQAQVLALSIEQVKRQYDLALAALRSNPPIDKQGKVLQQELQEKETMLLIKYQDDIHKQTFGMSKVSKVGDKWRYGNRAVQLTDEQGTGLRNKQASAWSAITKELASGATKMQEQALKTEDNHVKDELERRNFFLHKVAISNSQMAAVAIKRANDGFVDPLSAVEIKEKELRSNLAALESQRSKASQGARGPLDQEINKANEALDALLLVDKVLAKRQKGDQASQLRTDELEFKLSMIEGAEGVQTAYIAGQIASRSRQMQASEGNLGAARAVYVSNEEQKRQFAKAQSLREARMIAMKSELKSLGDGKSSVERRAELQKQITALSRATELALMEQHKALVGQAANSPYKLKDDKPTFRRFGHSTRLGSATSYFRGRVLRHERDFGAGLGAESARLVADFNESQRRKHGKLTDEEQAAAKEERRLNNQLEQARRAVATGGGTRKQRELVRDFETAKRPELEPVERIAKCMPAILSQLSSISGKKVEVAP